MAEPDLFEPWNRRRHPTSVDALRHSSADIPWDAFAPFPAAAKSPDDDDDFDRIKRNLMAHLRHAAHKLNLTLPPPDQDEPDPDDPPHPPTVNRRRRTAKAPRRYSSPPPPAAALRSSRARSTAAAKKRKRFSATLSREEIDEDFYALTGRRAPGRPKRRPPAVRRHVDLLFPGSGLADVTAACYEVAPPRGGSRGGG